MRQRHGRLRAAVGALALALAATTGLGGCAAPQSAALRNAVDSGRIGAAAEVGSLEALPLRAKLADVPFFAQTDYQCGPASLAMVLAAAGHPVPLPLLIDAVYLPERHGSLQAEMLAQPRREGMLSARLAPELVAVLRAVAGGTPALVFQNLGLSWAPVWHYAVLIGYDLPRGQVVLHSGTSESMSMSLETFERTWARAGHWAMVVTEPAHIPAAVALPDALRAAVALERIDRSAAMASYDALRERAPRDRLVLFAGANALLADAQPQAAVRAFRALLALYPGFADAWNNLAHALADAGDLAGARMAADRAVEIGGPSVDVYRQTATRMHAKAVAPTR